MFNNVIAEREHRSADHSSSQEGVIQRMKSLARIRHRATPLAECFLNRLE